MPRPSPNAYREALEAARVLMGELDVEAARLVVQDLVAFVEQLEALLTGDVGGISVSSRALRRAQEIVEAAADDLLLRLIEATTEGRRLSFDDVLEVWERTGRAAAASAGVPLATLGAVRTPAVTMIGAFEQIGGGVHWRTLLRGHVENAAAEANSIVRRAMLEGVTQDELARRLRRYVVGSEPFQSAFRDVPTLTGDVAKIDLRTVPAHMRDAARRMQHNALRIATSEIHNARAEAEIQAMIRDPLVEAVVWLLSPDRGVNFRPPDECDALAASDYYGLGRGVFPVDSVPAPPHPFDRSVAAWTPVLTRDGWRRVDTIEEGDLVLSHRGRWCRVEESIVGRTTGGWLSVVLENGRQLTITDDHPVLTPAGDWADAGSLSAGDVVVTGDRLADDVVDEVRAAGGFVEVVALEDEQLPPALLQERRLSSVRIPLLLRVVPPAVDLDGELHAGDSDVDVEPLDGPEGLGGDAGLLKSVPHRSFMSGELALVLVDGPRLLLENRDRPLPSGHDPLAVPCSTAALGRAVLEAEDVRLGRGSAWDAVVEKILGHDGAANPELLGDLVLRHLLVDVETLEELWIQNVVGQQIASVRISQVTPLSVVMRRYCLTVAQDNSFFAAGIAIHNCSRRPVPRDTRLMDQPKPRGELNPNATATFTGISKARAKRIEEHALEAVRMGREAANEALAGGRLVGVGGTRQAPRAVRAPVPRRRRRVTI